MFRTRILISFSNMTITNISVSPLFPWTYLKNRILQFLLHFKRRKLITFKLAVLLHIFLSKFTDSMVVTWFLSFFYITFQSQFTDPMICDVIFWVSFQCGAYSKGFMLRTVISYVKEEGHIYLWLYDWQHSYKSKFLIKLDIKHASNTENNKK